ncbi:U11/U12 small nuclear ribonucleoprotein [Rhynchospora pubera]|uniref:U11/U12 small nuclear ribonucleoprotein n=1 Tax=Rhynchospora pubera TaxID=906938 RepID=A0AAV8FNF7_9POAL|nr:U11/U12 small nuclear ribonucleoprotein [Rhynchospora pubera]
MFSFLNEILICLLMPCAQSMIPSPLPHGFVAPPQAQPWQPLQPLTSSFWQPRNACEHISKLQETIDVSKSMLSELEELLKIKTGSSSANEKFLDIVNAKKISLDAQESLSVEAANSICSHLKALVAPLASVSDQTGPWEERSLAVKLGQKMQKSKRNKLWRKKKRRRIAEILHKEHEDYDKIDQAADDWRAQAIAKDIAKRKVESMTKIAKEKANEEKKRLESELELILIVEKLKELRSIRIEKLKKQGHFFPEEDDKFIDRVRAAVEEEERLAVSAASTDAAMDAIATAEGSRKSSNQATDQSNNMGPRTSRADQVEVGSSGSGGSVQRDMSIGGDQRVDGYSGVNLPAEFYHYYHGSNYDMGTLVEVRRMWDAYLRPGGSRIPGHWVQPPPPANEVWASYLVRPK